MERTETEREQKRIWMWTKQSKSVIFDIWFQYLKNYSRGVNHYSSLQTCTSVKFRKTPSIRQSTKRLKLNELLHYPGIAYSSQANRKIIWSDLCKNVIFLCNTELHIWWSHWHDKTWKWWRKLCGIFQKPFRFLDSKNSKRLQLE